MLTEKQQEIVDEIMDNFDFERVHKTMIALNWGWVDKDDCELFSTPEVYELKSHARKLLKRSIENKESIKTGGFGVDKDGDYISLKFIVAEWDNYD